MGHIADPYAIGLLDRELASQYIGRLPVGVFRPGCRDIALAALGDNAMLLAQSGDSMFATTNTLKLKHTPGLQGTAVATVLAMHPLDLWQ